MSTFTFPDIPRYSQNTYSEFPHFPEFRVPKVPEVQRVPNFFHTFIHDYASPGLNLFNLVVSEFVNFVEKASFL